MPTRKNTKSTLTEEQVALLGIGFAEKKKGIKEVEASLKADRVPLEAYLKTNAKTLPNGSKLAVATHANVDVHLKHTLRVSKVLRPEAIDIIKEKGLADTLIETIPIVREDLIETLYDAKKLDDEFIKSIYETKESYAFSVDLKEHIDD